MNFKISFIIINILFLFIYYSYLPSFISKISDRFSFYSEMKDQKIQIDYWKQNKNELQLENLKLAAQISQIPLDIPTYQNPADLVNVINNHSRNFQIIQMKQTYLKYKRSGNYIFRKVKMEFDASYDNGIKFLHQLENDRHLMMIDKIEISNDKNRIAKPIHFTVTIELVLKE